MQEPLVESLRRLVEEEGGTVAVADKLGVNDQTLYQILKGVLLPSGRPKGVGPTLRAKLDAHYPGWRDQLPALDQAILAFLKSQGIDAKSVRGLPPQHPLPDWMVNFPGPGLFLRPDIEITKPSGEKAWCVVKPSGTSDYTLWRRLEEMNSNEFKLVQANELQAATETLMQWLGQSATLGSPAAPTQSPPTLETALETLGNALAMEMPDDVRDDVADALAKLARRRGNQRYQQQVLALLESLQSKQQAAA